MDFHKDFNNHRRQRISQVLGKVILQWMWRKEHTSKGVWYFVVSMSNTSWKDWRRREYREKVQLDRSISLGSLPLRACLYGLGEPRQPFPRDNFTKRLYENCMTETQLTLLNYAYILRRNKHHLPLSLCSSSFIKYSCVFFAFTKWTNTS